MNDHDKNRTDNPVSAIGGKTQNRRPRVIACGTCGANVGELRRGRCWSCYTRWQEQRPVGLGACCVVCDERRRDNLRLLEVQGRSLPLCHLCAAQVQKLDLVPYSIEGLRVALRRDRRQIDRRDDAAEKTPIPVDRRAVRRRAGAGSVLGIGAIGDDASVWQIGEGDLDLDLSLNAEGEVDLDDADIVEDVTVIAPEPQPNAPPSLSAAAVDQGTSQLHAR